MNYFNVLKTIDSCPLYGAFKDLFGVCTAENVNSESQQTENFGFGWSNFNKSYVAPNGYQSIYGAFQFSDRITLQGSSFQGHLETYEGSGYVYEMRGKLSYLQGNLSLMEAMNWIDRQTRAVFVEFSVYNPNIETLMVSTILVEFLPSGSILTSARFDPLLLFGHLKIWYNVCLLAFMSFIVYFMIVQIRRALNQSFAEYCSDFWTLVEWSIIVAAWISCVVFILRLAKANEVLSFFRQTHGYAYIKLDAANNYNQVLTYSLGML